MHGKDPFAVTEAVSVEITSALRRHREKTKAVQFRKGSRGRVYCDGLQMLISLLLNGTVPAGASPTFLAAVKPLVDHLLQKWEIGTLRAAFSRVPPAEPLVLPNVIDPLVVVVSRAEVQAMETAPALAVLKRLTESPETAKAFVERVDIAFQGYDQTPQELFEIPEVRSFVSRLDEEFPFWLFFLSKRHLGLRCLLFCSLPPFLTQEAQSRIFPERINQLLSQRWLPAMNQMCDYAGFSTMQSERLMDRAVRYITTGRFGADMEPFA